MNKNLYRIAQLLMLQKADIASKHENVELTDYVNTDIQNDVLNNLDSNYLSSYKKKEDKFDSQKGWERFVAVTYNKKRRLMWWQTSVAASVALLLFCSVLLYMNGGENVSHQNIAINSDTLNRVDKQRAIVKLADGREIMIDGEKNNIKVDEGVDIAFNDGVIDYTLSRSEKKLEYNELQVPKGGECFIRLSDGTKVWVNAQSNLRYPIEFIGEERKVTLQGEAYFEVVADSKPFVVETSSGTVNVLGTTFAVKAYEEDDEVLTTLVSGKVRFNGHTSVELYPGEQAVANKEGSVVKREVNIDEYIGWKESVYVFRDKRLEDIVKDLSRWYDISVFFQYSDMRDICFTGSVKRYATIDQFLEALKRTENLEYKKEGNVIQFYRR
ncbi:MAG: FecR family protein [Marinifilaceae bacterium]